MQQVIRRLNKIFKSNYFPLGILLISMIIFHMIANLNYGDDQYFSKVLQENQLLSWTRERYFTWTSRNIIEIVMVTILNFNPIVWKLIDIASVLLLANSISKLFINDNLRARSLIVSVLIILYPFKDMSTSGWGTATINYLWPLSFGIYSMVIIKKIINNDKIYWYEYIFSTLALIFAANAEQMCAILLAVYGMATLYQLLKHKIHFYMIWQTFLCLCSLVFILTCPGNAVRNVAETAHWFPDYTTLSAFNKLELGFSSTIAKLVFEPNLLFIMLSLLIFSITMIKNKNKALRVISAVPFICSILLGAIAYVISKVFPKLPNIVTSVTKYGTITKDNYYLVQSYIPIILLASIGICFLISLYFCFEDKNKRILVIFIVLLGLASRIVIGFSPTIWASMDRTFIYMYFSLIISAVMVYGELTEEEIGKLKLTNRIMGIFAFISFLILIAYTIVLQTFITRENLMSFINSLFN